jgi:hypothetical protein
VRNNIAVHKSFPSTVTFIYKMVAYHKRERWDNMTVTKVFEFYEELEEDPKEEIHPYVWGGKLPHMCY